LTFEELLDWENTAHNNTYNPLRWIS
jgi:hypothetical protein